MTRKDKPSYSIYSINNANRKMVICIEHWGSFVFTQCYSTPRNRLKTQRKKRKKLLEELKFSRSESFFFCMNASQKTDGLIKRHNSQ